MTMKVIIRIDVWYTETIKEGTYWRAGASNDHHDLYTREFSGNPFGDVPLPALNTHIDIAVGTAAQPLMLKVDGINYRGDDQVELVLERDYRHCTHDGWSDESSKVFEWRMDREYAAFQPRLAKCGFTKS